MIQAGYLKATNTGGGFPVLPSGTYVPKNAIVGAFDLLWEEATANVTTTDGEIEKDSDSGAWDGSAICRIPHVGDFSLRFKMVFTSETVLCRFGISYWKFSNETRNLDFAFYRAGDNFSVVETSDDAFIGTFTIDDSTEYRIDREGMDIKYYVDDVLQFTTTNASIGNFNIDCTIFSLCRVKDIELIIP